MKTFAAENPEIEAARKEAARAATQTAEYAAGALERYRAMEESGIGICSLEVRELTAEAGRWVMTKAQEALRLETPFVDLWRITQDRLRSETPYDGPLGIGDHYEYLQKLGRALTADPAIRACQDTFMREAIPRFYAEWKTKAAERPAE
jgi:hypothetical protein